jgi:hypothetical protein
MVVTRCTRGRLRELGKDFAGGKRELGDRGYSMDLRDGYVRTTKEPVLTP